MSERERERERGEYAYRYVSMCVHQCSVNTDDDGHKLFNFAVLDSQREYGERKGRREERETVSERVGMEKREKERERERERKRERERGKEREREREEGGRTTERERERD